MELFLADKDCKIEEMSATPMEFFVFSIIELVASFRVDCCLVLHMKEIIMCNGDL